MIKFFICFESFLDIFTVPIATWDPSTDFDIDWLHRVSIGKRDHLAKKNSINSNNKKSRLLQRNFSFSDGARGGTWSPLRPRPASPHWIWIPFKGFIGINSDSSPQYNRKIKPPFFRMRVFFFWWCPRGDLNPHTFRHTHLKRTCLPFHHPGRITGSIYICTCTPLECRPTSWRLALGSMALEYSLSLISSRTSTIPSPGRARNFMVHPVGFEPTTNGFEDRYSSNWAMGACFPTIRVARGL